MTSQDNQYLFNADFRRSLPMVDRILDSYEVVDGQLLKHDDWNWNVPKPGVPFPKPKINIF